MRLVSMTDFVLKQNKILETYVNHLRRPLFEKIVNYATFLKQPLKLEMFVPCDNDEEILKPQYIAGKEVIYNELVEEFIMDKVKEYNEAKAKVLFEGFNLNQKDFSKLESIFCLTKECFQITFFTKEKGCFMDNLKTNKTYEIKTIEDLIQYNLQLTENAVKQIGL